MRGAPLAWCARDLPARHPFVLRVPARFLRLAGSAMTEDMDFVPKGSTWRQIFCTHGAQLKSEGGRNVHCAKCRAPTSELVKPLWLRLRQKLCRHTQIEMRSGRWRCAKCKVGGRVS